LTRREMRKKRMATRRANVSGSIGMPMKELKIRNFGIKGEKSIKIKTMVLLKGNICEGTLHPLFLSAIR
jgi:hypothetical protein